MASIAAGGCAYGTDASVRKSEIVALFYSIVNPATIARTAACIVTDARSRAPDGTIVVGGLTDPRMGPSTPHVSCGTCGQRMTDCPGHHGVIELPEPMYHPGHIDSVRKILVSVCYYCSRLKPGNAGPKTRCAWEDCLSSRPGGGRNGPPTYEKITRSSCLMWKRHPKDETVPFTAEQAHNVLSGIPDEDIPRLGLAKGIRPEWLLLECITVVSPNARPQTGRAVDNLTRCLMNIITSRNKFEKMRNQRPRPPPHILKNTRSTLQDAINAYIGRKGSRTSDGGGGKGARLRSGAALTERLGGKAGRFRGDLMGKRGTRSARAVIGSDPLLAVNEIGVPPHVCRALTLPEHVTRLNVELMRARILDGRAIYLDMPKTMGGATERRRINLTRCRNAQRLAALARQLGEDGSGAVVERIMEKGDVVLFNRQPSLHRASMQAMRVRVLDKESSIFRMNPNATRPYNADFDGDEMNIFSPLCIEARVEALELAQPENQLTLPRDGCVAMVPVQSTLLGWWSLTQRDTLLDRAAAMDLLMWIANADAWEQSDGTYRKLPPPAHRKPLPLRWTGKQIFSALVRGTSKGRLPPLRGTANAVQHQPSNQDSVPLNVGDHLVLVRDDELLAGTADAGILGGGTHGIIGMIGRYCGGRDAVNFVTQLGQVATRWTSVERAHTIGLEDIMVTDNTGMFDRAQRAIERAVREFYGVPGLAENEYAARAYLDRARDSAGREVVSALFMQRGNGMTEMLRAGSKGTPTNATQLAVGMGLQSIDNGLVPPMLDGVRSFPWFSLDNRNPLARDGERTPWSRGFEVNSLTTGLTVEGFAAAAMAGREGLIDTSVKTKTTGYDQRRLIKIMESIIIRTDGTVRTPSGELIQIVYGMNGLDPARTVRVRSTTIRKFAALREGELEDTYCWYERDIPAEDLPPVRTEWRALKRDWVRLKEAPVGDQLLVAEDLEPLLEHAEMRAPGVPARQAEIATAVYEACRTLREEVLPGAQIWTDAVFSAAELSCMLLRVTLASRSVYGTVSRGGIEYICRTFVEHAIHAVAAPGEAVGTIAGQSVGERATQMTLNTFHYAGVSAKNVTMGIPRFGELINNRTYIKTPSMTLPLLPAVDTSDGPRAASHVVPCMLIDVVKESTITWIVSDEDGTQEDQDVFAVAYGQLRDDDDARSPFEELTKYAIRFVLDDAVLASLDMGCGEVEDYIRQTAVIGDVSANTDIVDICERGTVAPTIHLRGPRGVRRWNRMVRARTEPIEEFLDTVRKGILSDRTPIRGIRGVREAVYDPSEHAVITRGTNLGSALALASRLGLDPSRATSNHIRDVESALGLDAARAALRQELTRVIEFGGSWVNPAHIGVIVDRMAYNGRIDGYTYEHLGRSRRESVMDRATFERPSKVFYEAARARTSDFVRGISDSLVVGATLPLGFNAIGETLLDEDVLTKYASPSASLPSTSTTAAAMRMESPELRREPEPMLEVCERGNSGDGEDYVYRAVSPPLEFRVVTPEPLWEEYHAVPPPPPPTPPVTPFIRTVARSPVLRPIPSEGEGEGGEEDMERMELNEGVLGLSPLRSPRPSLASFA